MPDLTRSGTPVAFNLQHVLSGLVVVAVEAVLVAVACGALYAATRLLLARWLAIDGVTAFSAQTMTVRTSTRVKPGRHEAVGAALRFQIKETFDRQAASAPREALIPWLPAERRPRPAAGHGS